MLEHPIGRLPPELRSLPRLLLGEEDAGPFHVQDQLLALDVVQGSAPRLRERPRHGDVDEVLVRQLRSFS